MQKLFPCRDIVMTVQFRYCPYILWLVYICMWLILWESFYSWPAISVFPPLPWYLLDLNSLAPGRCVIVSWGRVAVFNDKSSQWVPSLFCVTFLSYTPLQQSWKGVYWFHLVRLSICRQNRVCSVSSTIFIGSISYLHILSSNFRRCVTCFKIQQYEIVANSLNLLLWLCLLLTWDGPNMTQ